jgi:hypothetical protein
MLLGGITKGTAQGSRYRAQGKNSKESGPKGPDLRVSGVGCPAYALRSFGVASRCQGRKTKQLKPEH